MTQNATQAKKSRSFTVGVTFRLSSYYSLMAIEKNQNSGGCLPSSSKMALTIKSTLIIHYSLELIYIVLWVSQFVMHNIFAIKYTCQIFLSEYDFDHILIYFFSPFSVNGFWFHDGVYVFSSLWFLTLLPE